MAPSPSKPLIWLLEEATPEVALVMHKLERSLGGQAQIQRVSYTEALRQLPHEDVREPIAAIIAFSLGNVQNLARLLKGMAPRPKLVFLPSAQEALAQLRPGQRWPVPVIGVARHLGEALIFQASGFKAEQIVRLSGDVELGALPDAPRGADRPLRVGLAWYNLCAAQREEMAAEINRWQQSAPERCEWHVFHLPDTVLPDWKGPGIRGIPVDAACLAAPTIELDVALSDPWWADGLPRPYSAPVQLFLPPGGMPGGRWQERLQTLLDLGEQPWSEGMLWGFRYQPLWKHLLAGDERELPALAAADTESLAALRTHLHGWLEAERGRLGPEAPGAALAYYHWVYDLRVEVSWCLDLWQALAGAKNGERHALMLTLNALRLYHASSSWLFKRLMGKTAVSRSRGPQRTLSRHFYWRFVTRHFGLVTRWVQMLWRMGKDEACDPLGSSREVAEQLLAEAGVAIRLRNAPAPIGGLPTIYLLSHRHGELDPFLLLRVLPGHLAMVVGPRAQRWPLIRRLGHSSAFVMTGGERGVVIADAIAAVRARRSLALYPEVAEPTYLGESSPFRSGLLWIVQALEKCQVIPVVLDDAFFLGPAGGTIDVWFGEPIVCTPESCEGLFDRVRLFFHQRVAKARMLDLPAEASPWVERAVPGEAPASEVLGPEA